MTSAEREHIRHQINLRARATLKHHHPTGNCAQCHADWNERTPGCERCRKRHNSRRRRN